MNKNRKIHSMIGLDYSESIVPSVIKRNLRKIQHGIPPILLINRKFLKVDWKVYSIIKPL